MCVNLSLLHDHARRSHTHRRQVLHPTLSQSLDECKRGETERVREACWLSDGCPGARIAIVRRSFRRRAPARRAAARVGNAIRNKRRGPVCCTLDAARSRRPATVTLMGGSRIIDQTSRFVVRQIRRYRCIDPMSECIDLRGPFKGPGRRGGVLDQVRHTIRRIGRCRV